MLNIKIPATTANMGPGFDSIGMALALYNYVQVREGTDNGKKLDIRVKQPDHPARKTLSWYTKPACDVPTDESNLIYKTICYFYAQMGKPVPPITLTQEDYIPMTGGLGSSAACIVAGLLAADGLTGRQKSREALIDMAAQLDGHPDNTTPALTGGLTVGVMTDRGLIYSQVKGAWEQRLKFALFVPAFTLPTTTARAALPEQYARADLVFNASRTALLVAALTSGDFSKLTVAMEDRAHQPYRRGMVNGMDEITRESLACGAYNVFLSGAGSALIAVTEEADFIGRIRPFVEKLPESWSVGWVEPDWQGATAD